MFLQKGREEKIEFSGKQSDKPLNKIAYFRENILLFGFGFLPFEFAFNLMRCG